MTIDAAAATAAYVRRFSVLRSSYYGGDKPDVALAGVARAIGVPVRTFQRWAVRTGFVASSRDLATKQEGLKR